MSRLIAGTPSEPGRDSASRKLANNYGAMHTAGPMSETGRREPGKRKSGGSWIETGFPF